MCQSSFTVLNRDIVYRNSVLLLWPDKTLGFSTEPWGTPYCTCENINDNSDFYFILFYFKKIIIIIGLFVCFCSFISLLFFLIKIMFCIL